MRNDQIWVLIDSLCIDFTLIWCNVSLNQGLSCLSEFYGWAHLGTMVLFKLVSLEFNLVCFFYRLVRFCCLGSGIWKFMQICVGFHLTPIDSHADSGFFLFLNTFRLSSLVLQKDFVHLFGCTNYGLCSVFVLFESIQLGVVVVFSVMCC